MFSPATVILVSWGPRLFPVKRRFLSSASRFYELVVIVQYCKIRCSFKLQLTAKLVISPCFASQVLPPTPSLVVILRGGTDDWLHKALFKCFLLFDGYGASSGTNYLKNYSGPQPTQLLLSELSGTAEVIHWHTCPALTFLVTAHTQ